MFRCRWNIIKYFSRVLYGENVDYIQLNIYSFLRNITSLVSFLNIIVAIKVQSYVSVQLAIAILPFMSVLLLAGLTVRSPAGVSGNFPFTKG
jgi:hypothetical protein